MTVVLKDAWDMGSWDMGRFQFYFTPRLCSITGCVACVHVRCIYTHVHSPHPPSPILRAWDQVLSNPYINASTSGFLGNWYIAFNQWAANQTTLTQTGNCYNPLYQRASGNLAGVINTTAAAQQITGCIPQAQFYSLLNQV